VHISVVAQVQLMTPRMGSPIEPAPQEAGGRW
jgi:hypothetical protein